MTRRFFERYGIAADFYENVQPAGVYAVDAAGHELNCIIMIAENNVIAVALRVLEDIAAEIAVLNGVIAGACIYRDVVTIDFDRIIASAAAD